MTAGEFQRYLKPAIQDYAKMHIRAGDVDPKKALGRAKALYAITLVEDGKTVGMVWFELKQRHGKRKAFIFDFAIDKAQRGKGFATRAMPAIEQQAKVLGAVAVDLHVFGHNIAARGLYEKCGYRYTGMHMSKDLY